MKVLLMGIAGVILAVPALAHEAPQGKGYQAPGHLAQATENHGIVRFSGVVRWIDLEGGFYALEARNGTKYDPMNLPAAYRKDGLAVQVEGRIRTDIGSFHMYGKILEIKSIKAL